MVEEAASTPGSRSRISRALEAVALGAAQRPLRVLALATLLAVAAAAYAARELRVHVDTDAMIAAELPHQQRWFEFARRHPLLAHPLVVMVEGPPGEAGAAADALAAAMRERQDLFTRVESPGREPFFARHGLLYLDAIELAELADRLTAAQPLLARLTRHPDLRGLFDVLDEAVTWRERVPGDGVAPLLDGLALAVENARVGGAGGAPALDELVLGDTGRDATAPALVLALPRAGHEGVNPAREAIDAVHALAAEAGLDAEAGYRVRATGDAALSADELELLRENGAATGIVSFVLVTGLLGLGLRSARLVIALCATLLLGLAWTAGFAALAVGRLNMISVAFAVMSIGLGVDFGIHLAARYRERMRRGALHREALRSAVSDTGASLVLCAATTTAAFYAFLPTDFSGLGEFGWISGTGILLSLVATLTVLPALLGALEPRFLWRRPRRTDRLDAWLELPQRRPAAVLAVAGAVTAVSVALLPGLRFSGNPLDLRAQDSESVSAFRELLARDADTTWNLQVIGRSPDEARRLAAELESLDVVARATTLSDWVPSEQELKLPVVEDLALMLGPLEPSQRRVDPEARVAALREFAAGLDCGNPASSEPVVASACRLRGATARLLARLGDGPARDAALARLESRLLDPLLARIAALDRALDAAPVSVASLPAGFRELWQASDGSWRVEVVPAGALATDAALAAFVDGVREVAPDATGMGVQVLEAERVVVRSLRLAFGLAALAIALLLWARWRRAGEVVRALAPLALSAVWILAAATLFGMPLNFANVIVLPLILGIGVDSGVHMLDRARAGSAGPLLRSSTAQAILLSALTTLASFGALAFSPHPGMASMGRLLALGVVFTLIANLVVLPALLAVGRRPATALTPPARAALPGPSRLG